VAIENGFRSQAVASPEAVAFVQPDFIVLAPEVTAHQGPPYLMREALLDGSAGYRLALRVRSPALPLPGRHPDLGPEPRHGPEYSDLSMINLLIEVFERRPPGADLVGKG
jgi:hypothetical protein